MLYLQRLNLWHLTCCAAGAVILGAAGQALAADNHDVRIAAQAPRATARGAADDKQILIQRLQQLEQKLNALEAQRGVPSPPPMARAGTLDTQAILDRLDAIEMRLTDLETNTVLSEPKTIVKQVEVYVDQNGNEYDHPVAGATPQITYQRERVFRRQTVDEAIEEALADQSKSGVEVGVSSVTTVQFAGQTKGPKNTLVPDPANPGGPPLVRKPNGHVFGVSQADVTFLAKSAALNTSFFADLVGIGGAPPDNEIPTITLLNSQTARLSNNTLNVREAWIRTELGNQQVVAVTVGQLDLTNYFDRNAVANDETAQFISDALVNDPVLGLTRNGIGAAVVYDPHGMFNFKLGAQQSTPNVTSLSDGLFVLGEVELVVRPFNLGEGRYRLWGRMDNTLGSNQGGFGLSIDQRVTPTVTVFARAGHGYVSSILANMNFYSGGLGFNAPYAFNPLDTWGIGFAETDIVNGPHQTVVEGYYNLHLTEHLALSAMLQYVLDTTFADRSYILPGARMKVEF
jgi:hypothetical protein